MDKALLTKFAIARAGIAVAKRLINHICSRCSFILDVRIRAHYSKHIFEAYCRLDVPTFDDPFTQAQLDTAEGGRVPVAWKLIQVLASTYSTIILLVSQLAVLYGVLREQRDGSLIALLSLVTPVLQFMRFQEYGLRGGA